MVKGAERDEGEPSQTIGGAPLRDAPLPESRARRLLRSAIARVKNGAQTREEALLGIPPGLLDELLHPMIDPAFKRCVIARGLPASPGAAWGQIVFSPSEAERLAGQGHRVILVRVETSPEDIHGMHAATGILTARGGRTSHAAVVARGMGKPCVTGAGEIRVDERTGTMHAGGMELKAGQIITLDGTAGQVLEGAAPMTEPELPADFTTLLEWADAVRELGVRANADTPDDVVAARRFGADGIGLCRTEHMFFDAARIRAVREMILAETEEHRRASLETLLHVQRHDFARIFRTMEGRPITVRLLDPPLHEFLPKTEEDTHEIAQALGMSAEKMQRRVNELDEFNPMLGFRGCRLAIAYPEIVEMQARAFFEAAVEVGRATGTPVQLEILVPLVAMRSELDLVKAHIDATAGAVEVEMRAELRYQIGAMIELPRAALGAGQIARTADFLSFGTNDLTQTVFGMSRDDAGIFLGAYILKGIMPHDPFTSIDVEGVGELVRTATERGRAVRPGMKLGLCGEHGGDPASIAFCQELGLSYVSCSPYRVPIARLAAAQAALRKKHGPAPGSPS